MKKYKDFPKEIQDIIKLRVEEQGNVFNLDVEYGENNLGGGFVWDETPEGSYFWDEVLVKENYPAFYEKYPKNEEKKIEEGQKFSEDKLPVWNVLFWQFPLAIQEVVKCSQAGHKKYEETDFDWQNFSKVKGGQFTYRNALLRHLFEADKNEFDSDLSQYGEIRHIAQVAWNALASLELHMRALKTDRNTQKQHSFQNLLSPKQYHPVEKHLDIDGKEIPIMLTYAPYDKNILDDILKGKEPKDLPKEEYIPKWMSIHDPSLKKYFYWDRPTLSVDQLLGKDNEDYYPDTEI